MRKLALLLCVFATVSCAGPDRSDRPKSRLDVGIDAGDTIDGSVHARGGRGLLSSLRPIFRTPGAGRKTGQSHRMRAAGAVCGDIAIQGETIGQVPGRVSGCGIDNAVAITSVSGVSLSRRSKMDCGTARALKSWVEDSAKPALSRKGGGLREIRVAAHYACRRRNHAKTGKISEHGRGRAIDISAFRLADGSEITVLKGWHAFGSRRALRRMHRGACGPFGTVLGPKADRFHRDHFHFDTATYRSGTYCR